VLDPFSAFEFSPYEYVSQRSDGLESVSYQLGGVVAPLFFIIRPFLVMNV